MAYPFPIKVETVEKPFFQLQKLSLNGAIRIAPLVNSSLEFLTRRVANADFQRMQIASREFRGFLISRLFHRRMQP
jgi:hypothetical protein